MRKTACSNCNTTDLPLNETIKVDGQTYCANCFSASFPEEKDWKGKKIEKEADPTICSSCQQDFDTLELNKISTYPVCPGCEIKIKNRTFPLWVKVFLIAVAAIVLFSFFWNWTYYQAYNNIQKANLSFQNGDYTTAANLMVAASEKAPEVQDVKTLASFFKGIDFLGKDKNEEALASFNECKDVLPEDYKINSLLIQARIGICFNNKDYPGFLSAAKEYLATDTSAANSWTSVASAYACIYADKADEDAKKEAFKYLERAKSIDSTSKEMKEYYNMVEYRIYSRQVLKRKDFTKQFPNGWTKN